MNPPQQALPVPEGSSAFSAMPYQPPQTIIPSQTQTKKCPTIQEIKEILAKTPLITYFIVITYSIYFIIHVLSALFRFVFLLSTWRILEHGFGFMLHALFLYFVWFPIAKKIESSSGTTRYATMFLYNIILLKIGYGIIYSSQCYDSRFYYNPYTWFVEFETVLVTLINKDKKLTIYGISIPNKFSPFIIVVYYCFISGFFNVFPIVTGLYALIYSKCLMNCLAMSNERVESIEKNCIVAFIIRKCKRYVTIPKEQQQPQPSLDVTNSNINNYPQVPQVEPQITPMNSSMNTVININQVEDRAEPNNSWSDLKNDFNNNHL